MSVRDSLILQLNRKLCGPRTGPTEILAAESNPRDEYITGVLAPVISTAATVTARDIDADVTTFEGDVESDEDDDDPTVIAATTNFSPALDPRSLPRSIGITFVLASEGEPRIEVCVVFARYFELGDRRWQRQPFYHLTGLILANDCRIPTSGDAEIRIRRTPLEPGKQRVSVFLINTARVTDAEHAPPTDKLIFQPQIRIVLGPHSRAVSLITSRTAGPTDDAASLELLYMGRPILARGHMCSAVWDDIDPERDTPAGESSPFSWPDEGVLPVSERGKFRRPDLRTETMPIYAISAPTTTWNSEFGDEPERDPNVLAELYDTSALRAALQPLSSGYARWIQRERSAIDNLPAMHSTAQHHLDLCDIAKNRMDEGIEALTADANQDLRLAFCFANKVIALQADWRGKPITWHPFQLGFILLCIAGIADSSHSERDVCDLLWFPTGGGKTEAYLGLAVFTLALRRLRGQVGQDGFRGETGVGVISRYTLRLLTIQQFRRALGVITACECLRTQRSSSGAVGWRPTKCIRGHEYLWGATRFSAGLWVGGGVTPNRLHTIGWPEQIPGALEILQDGRVGSGHGEPAQVLRCPCCDTHLAISQPRHERQERAAFPRGQSVSLHFVFYKEEQLRSPTPNALSDQRIQVTAAWLTTLPAPGFHVLSIEFTAAGEGVSARDVDEWWRATAQPFLGQWATLQSTRASRPGYFIRTFRNQQNRDRPNDFEIYCPNPRCALAQGEWRERVPIPIQRGAAPVPGWQEIIPPFQSANDPTIGSRCPIPARTVDEQLYSRPPSLIVSTVDKFARLAFEPQASSMFGYVTHYHARQGYYRVGALSHLQPGEDHPPVARLSCNVTRFRPPDLVLQDELHLIDGPLGSMVGIYEAAIDALGEVRSDDHVSRPKYIASTATVREATAQVQALFNRTLSQFPPPGLTADDNFFSVTSERHPSECDAPGRLYLGLCAPGKGAQTPIVRIWSVLLQSVFEERHAGRPDTELDGFWTLVGYFNAIRELAGATGLLRQDIIQRISHIAGPAGPRPIEEYVELSSRADALQLPALLARMDVELPADAVDAALATSMFGTGVDVTRLSLMCVHGQPKTTSSYIQATGRVGRREGALVVTFLRAGRPRDLDHYEFFTGYHRQLYRAVEPITVAPFSPRARERALGPLCVVMLRQAEEIEGNHVHPSWAREQRRPGGLVTGSWRMASGRSSPEVVALTNLFEERSQQQPQGRRPNPNVTAQEVGSELDVWRSLAQRYQSVNDGLCYAEYAITNNPTHPVVLGDAQHQRRQLEVAYEDAPQSLRDVEATTGFKV